MRRYKHLSDVQELMWDHDHVRDIGIIAHIDHGKCVSPRTRIALANRITRAETLFEKNKEEGEIEKESEDEICVDVSDLDIEVNSFDKNSKEIVRGKITKMWKMKKTDPLVHIVTGSGNKIKTTPEHQFLTLEEDGSLKFTRANQLEEGMNIVSARKLTHSTDEEDVKDYILSKLSKDYGFYVFVSGEFNEKIRKMDWDNLYKFSKSKLKKDSFEIGGREKRYRLRDIYNICKELDLSLKELYEEIRTLNYRGKEWRGEHSSLPIKLPPNLSPLYYLAGLCMGDGDLYSNITNSNPEIHEKVRREASKLGLDVTVREFKNRTSRIELGGKTLTKILQSLFDYPIEEKSRKIKVSDLLFMSKKEDISLFIQGYLDADGTIEKERSAVSVNSNSIEMLEGIQLLLLKFDVASKINRVKSTLYISGRLSLEEFSEIGFSTTEKQRKLKELLAKSQSSKLDYVPIKGSVLKNIRCELDIPQTKMDPGYSNYESTNIGLSKNSLKNILTRFEEEGQPTAEINELKTLAKADTSFTEVEKVERSSKEEYVYDFTVEDYHNFIAEGIIVHNTTLTDSLVADSGIISEEHAGEQLFTDFMEEEQERGITIQTAAVSLAHEFEDEEYLINLLDTPGHVDFSGDVTRALRAIDGAVVVVDAVEGVMVQTETVLRQAIREHVHPILYINKVDRLIDELKLNPEEMQEKFIKIITKFNKLLKKYAPDELAERWKVSVEGGSVAFGSATEKWALSATQMEKKNITFKDIIDAHEKGETEKLTEESPLDEVILDMVVHHLPNPDEAQAERITEIWRGDPESKLGKSMIQSDKDGPLCMIVTDVEVDEQAGVVSTGRVFSGTLEVGKEVHLVNANKGARVQQVGVYMGPDRVGVEKAPAGNIAAVIGMEDAIVGETIVEKGIEAQGFEDLQYVSEPVVTIAVEPKEYKDLPQLIEEMRRISREDPNVVVDIDEETGEYLISGMGELHLQIVQHELEDSGLEIQTSEPLVVYRESIKGKSGPVEGVSPNRHNRLKFAVEPLEEEVVEALDSGEIYEKQDQKEKAKKLRELGWETKPAKNVLGIEGQNIFVDTTKGIQYLREIEEYMTDAFRNAVDEGPLMNEPVRGVKVMLTNAKLHEDTIHRGPAQIMPATRKAIHAVMLSDEPTVLEPFLKVEVRTPQKFLGDVTQVIKGRRGQVNSIESEEDLAIVDSSIPVSESFGLSADMRSSTEGRALWGSEFEKFDEVPQSLQGEAIRETRERKGMKPKPPKPGELVE